MTHTSQGISPLRQRMIDDMRMRKLAPKTQAGYVRVVRQFTAFLDASQPHNYSQVGNLVDTL
jgi:hypothetical protein